MSTENPPSPALAEADKFTSPSEITSPADTDSEVAVFEQNTGEVVVPPAVPEAIVQDKGVPAPFFLRVITIPASAGCAVTTETRKFLIVPPWVMGV